MPADATPGVDAVDTLDALHAEIRRRQRTERQLADVLAETSARLDDARASYARFTSIVVHDLASPLTSISGMVQLIDPKYELSGEEVTDVSARIVTSVDRAMAMLDSIRTDGIASMADAENDTPPATPASEAVEWALDTLGHELASATVEVVGPLPSLPVRPMALRHAVLNLISSAALHALPGETLRIRIDSPEDRSPAGLRIADSGQERAIDLGSVAVSQLPPSEDERNDDSDTDDHRAGVRDLDRGVGLDVAIAAALLAADEIDLVAEESPLGGSAFALRPR